MSKRLGNLLADCETAEASLVNRGEKGSISQVPALARRILPAEISRRAMTIALLSDSMSGFAPFKSCFALFAASTTSSKRLGMCNKQSSTVILAMASMLARRINLNKSRFQKHDLCSRGLV